MENIFLSGYCGSQVTEESFFGRREYFERLRELTAPRKSSKGISIIGLNHIGKSSLVQEYIRAESTFSESDVILIERTLSDSTSPNEFWHSFTQTLYDEWRAKASIESDTEEKFKSILNAPIESSTWFNSRFLNNIKVLLKRLKEANLRLFFVIDEFDYAREIFSKNGGLSLIRDMGTMAAYNITVITLSRRTLYIIQKEAVGAGSTLSESFVSLYLSYFNSRDMEAFYDAFSDYDIFPLMHKDFAARLQFYAGTHPFLLSVYAYNIVKAKLSGAAVNSELVDQIHAQEYSKVEGYYKIVLERMIEDGYAEDIRSVLCGPNTRLTKFGVDTYLQWGYLSVDEEGYYSISRDFTKFLIRETQTMSLPEWDAVMQAENFLKDMVIRVYPRLNEFTYDAVMSSPNWCNDLAAIYPELGFHAAKSAIEINFKKALSDYHTEETLIGVLTLGSVVDHIITKNWEKFKPYFRNEQEAFWKYHLKLLIRARNPLAHNHPEYLTEGEKKQLPATCALICELAVPV